MLKDNLIALLLLLTKNTGGQSLLLPKNTNNLLYTAFYKDASRNNIINANIKIEEDTDNLSSVLNNSINKIADLSPESLSENFPYLTKIVYYFYNDIQEIINFLSQSSDPKKLLFQRFTDLKNKWSSYQTEKSSMVSEEEILFIKMFVQKITNYFPLENLLNSDENFYKSVFYEVLNEELRKAAFNNPKKDKVSSLVNFFITSISADLSSLSIPNHEFQKKQKGGIPLIAWLNIRLALLVLPPLPPTLEFLTFLSTKLLYECTKKSSLDMFSQTQNNGQKDFIKLCSVFFSPDLICFSLGLEDTRSNNFSAFMQKLDVFIYDDCLSFCSISSPSSLSQEQKETLFNYLIDQKINIKEVVNYLQTGDFPIIAD